MSFRHSASSDSESAWGHGGGGGGGGGAGHGEDEEYNQCHADVYENIKALTILFGTISQQAQAVGTKEDSLKHRNTLKQNIDNATKSVKETQAAIKRLATLCTNPRAGKVSQERKQKVDKLSQDFNKFTDKLRELVKIANDKADNTPIPADRSGRDNNQSLYSSSSDNNDENRVLLQRQQEHAQLEDDLDFQDSIVKDRDQQIRAIQGQMVQVNEIFRDLAKLVEDQGEMIDNIQTNIVSASQNVEAGLKEVKDADKSQQSSRKKLCFLAIFVTVLVAIVVIVVVVLTKK